MNDRYERNRRARNEHNERALMGETLAQFHERENPKRLPPGAGMSRTRCRSTEDLFSVRQPQLFDNLMGTENDEQ